MAKVQVNSQNKVYTDSNKALIAQERGEDTNYKIYFQIPTDTSSDSDTWCWFNDNEPYNFCAYLSEIGTSVLSLPFYTGVKTMKFTADHWSDGGFSNGYTSARFRPHSGGNWTWVNRNQTYTLTEDIDFQIICGACLAKGTLITMANDTYKPIEEIEVGDYVKGYDGKSLKVVKSQKGQKAFGEDRDIWKFENGYEVITTFRHRFYNIEHQRMMYLNEWKIGEHAYSEKGEKVALLEHIHEDTPCIHFSLWCEEQNYFAGCLLAGNRFTKEIRIN